MAHPFLSGNTPYRIRVFLIKTVPGVFCSFFDETDACTGRPASFQGTYAFIQAVIKQFYSSKR